MVIYFNCNYYYLKAVDFNHNAEDDMFKKVMGFTLIVFYFLTLSSLINTGYAEVVQSDDDTLVSTSPRTVIETKTVPSTTVAREAPVAKSTGRTVASTVPSDTAVVTTTPSTEKVVTTVPTTDERVVVEHERYGLFHVVGKILAFPFKLVGGVIETIF
jgi:hypothetical protein